MTDDADELAAAIADAAAFAVAAQRVEPETKRPVLRISEAADATGKSRRSIGRMIDRGELPGAYRYTGDDGTPGAGPWLIPVDDLVAAGLRLHAPTDATPPTKPPATSPAADDTDADRLHLEVAEWRRRAEVAEAVAAERADALDDLRQALAIVQRMIDADPLPTAGSGGRARRRPPPPQ